MRVQRNHRHFFSLFFGGVRSGICSLAFILLFMARGQAQGDALQGLQAKWDAWRTKGIQEKIFVHADKPWYLAGEVLWCKLYCVDATLHTALDISKVAYVDLLDKDDHPILQGKISLEKGEGQGSFSLPLTLNSGNYRLRAYTNWMKNFGPDHFYEQTLSVFNTLKDYQAPRPDSPATPSHASFSVAFFPEGGNLVKGITSKVAFRITAPDGKGVDGDGVVTDENKDTVASFRSLHNGIGSFLFTPRGDHHYSASIFLDDHIFILRDLPTAYEQGYALRLDAEGEKIIRLTVHARGASSPDLSLLGLSGQSLRLALSARLAQDSAVFRISRDSLPEGITQLTLFDGAHHPVCERLYFRRPLQQLPIELHTDKEQYATRSRVNLSLAADGSAGLSTLSLAVYRLGVPDEETATDIYSYLWLSSDLKGNVESPEYYFRAMGPAADEARDNLMLTHGWRRFRWENILQDRQPVFSYPPEFTGHIISGRLTDAQTGQPVPDRLSSLTVPGTNFIFETAQTDAAGRLFFDVRDFYGTGGIILHSGTNEDSVCKAEILSPFSEQYSRERLLPFILSARLQRQSLADRNISMQVQNIYTGDSLRKFHAPFRDSLHFFGVPDYTYLLDNYVRFTTMEEVLREYVREIGVNRPHGKLHALMLDEPLRAFFEDNNTLVLLDGVPVPDDKIFTYDPLKVRKLEVIPRLYFKGRAVFSGIASFTTYNGDYEGLELDRHSLLIDYEGLQWQREFYAPTYETPEAAGARLPDFRDLLFWSPVIRADRTEKKDLSFYTSDLPGKYRVVVQGISADGRVGVKVTEFEVK